MCDLLVQSYLFISIIVLLLNGNQYKVPIYISETITNEENEIVSVSDNFKDDTILYFIDEKNGILTEDSVKSICKYIGDIYDISPALLQAIMWHESGYNYKITSSANAKGLCQIIEYWNRDRIDKLKIDDIYDPLNNALICADLLNEIRGYPNGHDDYYVLMVYNQGKASADAMYSSGIISSYAKSIMFTAKKMEENYD